MRSDASVWDTLKEKKRRSKGHSALGEAEANREPFLGEFPREQETWKRESFNLRGAVRKDREKHGESVRE